MIAWAEEAGNGDRGTLILAKVPDTKAERVDSESTKPQTDPDLIMDASFVSQVRGNKWVGDIKFVNGHSGISLNSATLYAKRLVRAESSRSTLSIVSLYGGISFDESPDKYAINDDGGLAIIPWATVDEGLEGDPFFSFAFPSGSRLTEFKYAHMERNLAYWSGARNAIVRAESISFNTSKSVNSLTLWEGGIDLRGNRLIIKSGGLFDAGSRNFNIHGTLGSWITTAKNRPLYIHGHGKELSINGEVKLTGGMDVVKTGAGSLNFNSTATHEVGAVYIHQGILNLQRGRLSVSGAITVGDGSETDKLRMAGNRKNQIVKRDGGRATIILKGDVSMGAKGGATLELGGNTQQELAKLHIEKQGVIDWVGGKANAENILWLDELSFSDPGAKLFMRNWREYEDIFLVRKAHFDLARLQNITFEGYERFQTTWRDYNQDFIEIIPGGIPEPATTAALLSLFGIAAYLTRRRSRYRQGTVPHD